MTVPDVIVIGGGVVGLSIAWRSAQAGLAVTVIDGSPGRGASWAAAGLLAPVTEVHYGEEDLLKLNLASARRYPGFVAELEDLTGRNVGYRRTGTVMVAKDADENAAIDEFFRFQVENGLEVERLSGRACRDLEPALSPRVSGGILVPGDHSVDNRALVEALVDACQRSGVTTDAARATALDVERGTVRGVVLDDGRTLSSPRAVLAAGCWSTSLDGIPPEAVPPVRPVKGQLLYVRGPKETPLLNRNVRGIEVYIVPRGDGRIVIGATVEEMGFDMTLTVGAVYGLLRDAYEIVPGITELELVETVVGLRPGSPDNAPVLGPTTVEGLVVASGHYRSGILLAPITGDAIAELIAKDALPEYIEPFLPQRFSTPELAS